MSVTMKDIARETNCSIATVSLALSDKESRISAETRRQIREVAKRMNYFPNKAAVSLVTNRSRTIGAMMADLTNPHISTMFMAMNTELNHHGYVLLCRTTTDMVINDYTVPNLSALVSEGLIGLILCQPYSLNENPGKTEEVRSYLAQTGLPVVTRDLPQLNSCGVDVKVNYYGGGYMATKHLLNYGHTCIGCVIGTEDYEVTQERIRGYRAALEEFGIAYDDELLFRGDYGMNSGSKALPYLLGKQVTAIFSFNDEMAFGIYRSARQYGIRIPQDLSVIGFDNVPFDEVLEVPLTTIHIPTEEIGVCAAREIVDMIEHGIPKELRVVTYEPTLMIRGSTALLNK